VESLAWRVQSLRSPTDLFFNFAFLNGVDTDDAVAVLAYIPHQIMTRSGSHAVNCLAHLRDFLTSRAYRRCEEHLPAINAWRVGRRKAALEYTAHYVRDWWLWSYDQGLDGFDDADTRWALLDMTIPGNVKGVAVLSEDPNQGPLFDAEEVALRVELDRQRNSLSREDRALAWLFISHGPNPMNVALLREEDFRRYEVAGQVFYELKIPRIKKRVSHRSQFRIRKLDLFLGELLHNLIEENAGRCAERGQARPLFWSELPRRTAPVHEGLLPITARRLRYSFASRLVRQGASIEELVDLLDHTDEQNVLVYFKNRDV
jgi:integrase